MWLIWETFQHTRRSIDEVVRAHGVSAAQLGILNRLTDRPGLSGAEIARQMLITPQAAHSALSTLERKGLIARQPVTGAGRVVCSAVTEDGRRVVDACRGDFRKVERRLVAALSPEQRIALIGLLRRYVRGSTTATG